LLSIFIIFFRIIIINLFFVHLEGHNLYSYTAIVFCCKGTITYTCIQQIMYTIWGYRCHKMYLLRQGKNVSNVFFEIMFFSFYFFQKLVDYFFRGESYILNTGYI
jgi:hypothetical protein